MIIQFLEDTNIRFEPKLGDETLVGQVYSGQILRVEDSIFVGEALEGNNRWYRDANGWFYWSGRAEQREETNNAQPEPDLDIFVTDTNADRVVSVVHESDLMDDLDDLPSDGIPVGETRLVTLAGGDNGLERRSPITASTASTPQPAPVPAPVAPINTSLPQTEVIISVAEPQPTPTQDPLPVSDLIFESAPAPAESSVPQSTPTPTPPPTSAPTPASTPWWSAYHRIQPEWWQKGFTGKGVRVAILSTGIDTACTELTHALADGYIAAGAGDDLNDSHGIGTQAAVLALGRGPQLWGIAPDADLLAVKIGEVESMISLEALLDGLDWAIAAEADIIAMLVDIDLYDDRMKEVIQQKINLAFDKNIWLTAPVGTLTDRRPVTRYPAASAHVLAVGAHDQFGQRCIFSAKSDHLDLLAPGDSIPALSLHGEVLANNLPSTSIATAFAAGALALLRQQARINGTVPDADIMIDQLRRQAEFQRSHVEKGQDVEYGYGLLKLA